MDLNVGVYYTVSNKNILNTEKEKDMNDGQYDPAAFEKKWYKFWESEGFFRADPSSDKPPFCIVLPPPNVTGILHIGHALVDTLQDILVRRKKMQGYEAIWLPGTDHAGISTQTVVERYLHSEFGKRRCDFSRVEFLSHVWTWKEKHEQVILNQLRKLGCALDWSMLRFTMDEKSNIAVRAVFKKMYDDGLIYRGDYLVNWDTVLQTAIADDEVEYEDRDSHLWYIKYEIEESDESIVVATTRPETMLGDTAVAVAPNDDRFCGLIGKRVRLPFVGRLIPVIADKSIDQKFGTGCVKITPAHDPNDYEIGIRHALDMVNIMNPDGTINENGGEFVGLSMENARKKIVASLDALGLLVKIEPHAHRVGVSYRSKAVIEPYISKQWFVNMSSFKEMLLETVNDQLVKLIPGNWIKTYNHWIENLKDWCISRQLWWGHRIPVWYNKNDTSKVICYVGNDEPLEVKNHPDDWYQDEDVLDTWFSSALWPLTTLGWPEKTVYLDKFYPTSTLITGHDILFFWVARMILMGRYVTNLCPFRETFVHGLIYGKSYWRNLGNDDIAYLSQEERLSYEMGEQVPGDVQCKWEKMSKSKGNVVDPSKLIDQYGADAVRLALCSSVTHSKQIDLDLRKFEEYKNFINKIWNASKFVFMNFDANKEKSLPELDSSELSSGLDMSTLLLEDKWILSVLNRTIHQVNRSLENYEFDSSVKILYEFFWNSFCAYYLELSKPHLFGKTGSCELRSNKQKILFVVLFAFIRLIHPIAPFVTEEIFHTLRNRFRDSSVSNDADVYTAESIPALIHRSCLVSNYPSVICDEDIDLDVEEKFTLIKQVIHTIRNIRGEMQIPPSVKTDAYFVDAKDKNMSSVKENIQIIKSLVNVDRISFVGESEMPSGFSSCSTCCGLKILIPLPKELRDKERNRIAKEVDNNKRQIESLEKKLSQQEFVRNAPTDVVEKSRLRLSELKEKMNNLYFQLDEE